MSNNANPPKHDPISAVHALFDAVRAADVDTIASLLHPDLEVTEPKSLPYGGVYRGKDAFLQDLFPKLTGLVDIAIEDLHVIGDEHVAIARMMAVFTSRRSEASLHMPYVEVYELADRLIRKITVYPSDTRDLAEFLEANG